MIILGIDPGYAIVGWGVVSYDNYKFKPLGYGALTTPADMPFENRLLEIHSGLEQIIEKYNPQVMSIEKLYFGTNHTTAIDVAQARGVTVLAAAKAGLKIYEYTPMQVKQAVTGYGKAEKKQMMEMTKRLLGLQAVPKPDDTADALAMAICHGHCSGSRLRELYASK